MSLHERVATEVIDEVKKLNLEDIKLKSRIVREKLEGINEVYVIYDLDNSVPAQAFYWTISTLNPKFNVKIFEVQTFLSLIAPYTSNTNILAFIDDDLYAKPLRDNMVILRNTITLITSNPKIVKSLKSGLEVQSETGFINLLSKTSISLLVALDMMREESQRRVNKVINEVLTSSDIVVDMLRYYKDEISRLSSERPSLVIASDIIKSQAIRAYDIKVPVTSWSYRSDIPKGSIVHVWKTSLEDHVYTNFIRRTIGSNLKLSMIDFRTDPISAQVYSLIVSEAIIRLRELLGKQE